jgi:hypothetical protein
MRLASKYYFFVEIKWSLLERVEINCLYWNVYLTNGLDENKVTRYVGTSKVQEYKLCLELADFEFPYGLDHTDHETCGMNRRFSLSVQSVTKALDITKLDDSQATCDVCLPGKRATINQIVYDFEFL